MKTQFFKEIIRCNDDRVIVFDADCKTSTCSYLFEEEYPKKYFNCGITEQNMVGMAAGASVEGLIPIINSFSSMLVFRAAEQIIHSICFQNRKVIIAGHYSGISAATEGAAHHCLNDIAFCNSLSNMRILSPPSSDLLEESILEIFSTDGPTYIRLEKDTNTIKEKWNCEINEGFYLFGNPKCKVLILTYGSITIEALKVMNMLNESNVNFVSVCSLYRIKPFPKMGLFNLINAYRPKMIILEEHWPNGGLYQIVSAAFSEIISNISLKHLCIPLEFTSSGTIDELRKYYHIDSGSIINELLDD